MTVISIYIVFTSASIQEFKFGNFLLFLFLIRAKKTGSAVEIEIWDTGIGIAAENMEKIFEGFFRVDTPYSRLTEGTGLGLPLSRKLVELHGGILIAESEGLNKGTRVRVTLPIISGGE